VFAELHEQPRSLPLDDDEVDLAAVAVPEVAQLEIAALAVLAEVAHFSRCAATRFSKLGASPGTSVQSRW
jgi:hypothetical protein